LSHTFSPFGRLFWRQGLTGQPGPQSHFKLHAIAGMTSPGFFHLGREKGAHKLLSGLAWNHDPPNLNLSSMSY
jgi:hypothetical protein